MSSFHTEKAIATIGGVADLARSAAAEARQLDDDALRSELEIAAEEAAQAVEAFRDWLRDELAPRATGDFRLGPELYAQKFRHALKTDVAVDELEHRATAAFAEVRGEMLRLARQLWPDWIRDEPMPSDDTELVRRVLDAISTDHPLAGELLDFCRAENARIEAFIGERDLIGLADKPMQIIWTPPVPARLRRRDAHPAGTARQGLDSFFAITPPPDDWTDEQVESMLREDNARQLRLLTIHEAVPGHYLQLAYSNRTDSLVRAIFQSGVFAEGWAVYVTQVMMDVGYGADDPALMLVHWKFYLRAITNTMMDIGITPAPWTGGRDAPHGRRRLAGAVGGDREMVPRAPVEHAAVRVLPRQRRDARPRGGGTSPRRGRRQGVRLSAVPRVGDRPRHAVAAGHPRDPVRRR